MTFKSLKDLAPGKSGDILVLLKKVEFDVSKTGEHYQRLVVRDTQENELVFLRFDSLLVYSTPIVLVATVECSEYKGSMTVKLTDFKEAGRDIKIGDFLPKAQVDAKECWGTVNSYLKKVRPGLSRIVCKVILENKAAFLSFPLKATGAFSRQCGILEATIKLAKMAAMLAEVQGLDHDLMVASALLYYIGHVETIDQTYNYTSDDVLTGAGLQAYNKVQMAIRDIMSGNDEKAKEDVANEDTELLSHILVSRFQGVRTAIAEAVCLRYLDTILQETDEINGLTANAPSGSIINNGISRRLYCRRKAEVPTQV